MSGRTAARSARGLALALALLAATPALADSLVYKPRHRLASELLPLAETALAGEGTATADPATNSLVLLGPPAALDRALELLNQQDWAPRNVVVHYESRRMQDLEAEGLRVDWQIVAGKVRVGNVRLPQAGSAAAVAAGAERERDRDAVQGMIRVIEGSAGHVSAGVEVPVSARALTPYGVREERGLVRAASGFDVTPQVLGDGRVRLEIAPFDERLAAPSAGGTVVERAGASTAITVMPGEKVAIGSLARESTSGGVGFVGIGREESREERVILVWVDLEE